MIRFLFTGSIAERQMPFWGNFIHLKTNETLMNISGKVLQILPEATGEGRNGPWSRQDFIIETEDQFPKKICISVWNGKIRIADLQPGDPVNVEISVESREYNGRWYTDVKALGLALSKKTESGPAASGDSFLNETSKAPPPTAVPDDLPEEEGNDLPF